MKLKNAAVAFAAAALMTATAANAATNINISIGDPGYWGVIPALTGHAPRVWNSAPVVAIGAAPLLRQVQRLPPSGAFCPQRLVPQ